MQIITKEEHTFAVLVFFCAYSFLGSYARVVLGDHKETMLPRVLRVLSGNENSGNFYRGG